MTLHGRCRQLRRSVFLAAQEPRSSPPSLGIVQNTALGGAAAGGLDQERRQPLMDSEIILIGQFSCNWLLSAGPERQHSTVARIVHCVARKCQQIVYRVS